MTDSTLAPEQPTLAAPRVGVAARPLTRRSSLPSGRAVVGGFLIALAGLGIFAAYGRATADPTTSYVVARHDIPLGTRLAADDLTELAMDLPAVVAANAVFGAERELLGATTVGPIRRGELVQAGDVVKKRSGEGEFEVSFAIDSARALAGRLVSGESVDVVATFGAGGETYTVAVVRGARVLDTTRRGGDLGAGGDEVVSLGLRTSDEALAVTHAVNAGEVTLVRSSPGNGGDQAGQVYRAPAADKGQGGDG